MAPDLPESEYGRYKDIYVRYFLQSDASLKLFPGVLELLRELQDAGIKTAIATGKSRKGLSRIVNRMNVWDYFNDSITADEALPKPDPLMLNTLLERNGLTMDEIVVIGDTEHDIKLGQSGRSPHNCGHLGCCAVRTFRGLQARRLSRTRKQLKTKLDESA